MTTNHTLQQINVFISSPGDVYKERQIARHVIAQLNQMHHIASHYVLKPLGYEREVPAALGKSPQMTVDHYMMEASKSDIFICIMWQRIGTPVVHEVTGEQFQSGTEYEFISAYRANQQYGKPHMLLYRSIKPVPHNADPEQMKRVQDFFKCFQGDDPQYKGFYKTYRTEKQFAEMLFHDIDAILTKGSFKLEVTEEIGPTPVQDTLLARATISVEQEYSARELRLKAMLADHSGFIGDRLESFVGRQAELQELQLRIAEQMKMGGYITITGQAGQGKSSIIAKLVEKYGPENVAFHFIPINPGPSHQIGLMRNLMARLILKYQLSDIYASSESYAALRDYFPKVLGELVAKNGREIIFIDGLDQLEEEANGARDLSFLPNNPPPGIVFVLGTRPNDTLQPLELLKPRYEYKLPNLSRQDFDLILQRRRVHLDRGLANQFYEAMQKNALYLDLVAKELMERDTDSPTEIIKQLADNPENLFSLSITRLKRQLTEWREVIKPILGVLLAAREPLSKRHIRQIIAVSEDRLSDGMERLGGLITDDGQYKYSLFHSKLRDYLRQDELHPDKRYIFATDEEEGWHKVLAEWCEGGNLSSIWSDEKNMYWIQKTGHNLRQSNQFMAG